MLDFANINDIINSNVTCRQVLEDLCGLDVRVNGRYATVLCPAHNDTHHGSCWVKENGIHCFACGFHEGTIGVLEKVKGITYLQAVKMIKETYNLPIDLNDPEDATPKSIMRLDSRDLALIGINDTKSLKVLYNDNRTLFWEFLDECTDYVARSLAVAEDDDVSKGVREALKKRADAVSVFCEQLTAMKNKNTPDTILLIKLHREGGKTDGT